MTETGEPPEYLAALSAFVRGLPSPAPDYCLIGALALGVWGAVRATQDIDFLMLLEDDKRDAVVASLSAAGFQVDTAWADLNPNARDRFMRFGFGTHAVDLMLARDAYHREALARRRTVAIDRLNIAIACAEDLMLLKLRAGRDQDYVDVISIAARQGPALDVAYLQSWSRRLGVAGELEYVLKAASPQDTR